MTNFLFSRIPIEFFPKTIFNPWIRNKTKMLLFRKTMITNCIILYYLPYLPVIYHNGNHRKSANKNLQKEFSDALSCHWSNSANLNSSHWPTLSDKIHGFEKQIKVSAKNEEMTKRTFL